MDIILANAPGTEPGNLRTERRSGWVLSENNPQSLQSGAPQRFREWLFDQQQLAYNGYQVIARCQAASTDGVCKYSYGRRFICLKFCMFFLIILSGLYIYLYPSFPYRSYPLQLQNVTSYVDAPSLRHELKSHSSSLMLNALPGTWGRRAGVLDEAVGSSSGIAHFIPTVMSLPSPHYTSWIRHWQVSVTHIICRKETQEEMNDISKTLNSERSLKTN